MCGGESLPVRSGAHNPYVTSSSCHLTAAGFKKMIDTAERQNLVIPFFQEETQREEGGMCECGASVMLENEEGPQEEKL